MTYVVFLGLFFQFLPQSSGQIKFCDFCLQEAYWILCKHVWVLVLVVVLVLQYVTLMTTYGRTGPSSLSLTQIWATAGPASSEQLLPGHWDRDRDQPGPGGPQHSRSEVGDSKDDLASSVAVLCCEETGRVTWDQPSVTAGPTGLTDWLTNSPPASTSPGRANQQIREQHGGNTRGATIANYLETFYKLYTSPSALLSTHTSHAVKSVHYMFL